MSVRMLCIKRANIERPEDKELLLADMQSFDRAVRKVFGNAEIHIDVCSVTDELEWLMHGRALDPSIILGTYQYLAVFVHSGNIVFDAVQGIAAAYSPHTFFMYRMSDMIFHHAERLQSLIKTNASEQNIKFPHQKHIDIKAHNENFTLVEDIVRTHFRGLFLPIHILDTDHRSHLRRKKKDLAHTAVEFAEILHDRRLGSEGLTFREHIAGTEVYVASIPHFRQTDMYTSIPLSYKDVNGFAVWDTVALSQSQRDEIARTVKQVSCIAFSNQAVVYTLAVHPKRGVFIQSTLPLMSYLLHEPDFFFTMAKESGIPLLELFVLLGYNS